MDVLRAVAFAFSLASKPFRVTCGLLGAISYDFIDQFEKLPPSKKDLLDNPDYELYFADNIFLCDHEHNKGYVIVNCVVTNGDREAIIAEVEECLDYYSAIERSATPNGQRYAGAIAEASTDTDQAEYEKMVRIRPIAGTKPRGKIGNKIDADTDFRYEAELKLDRKELAEHMMLVDLARNDIARVAQAGSRVVTELLIVEKYASVQHLVSNVKGILASDLDALNAYLATMNMGTLTGAPKIEAMKLIRLFEKTKRGYYGGAVCYLTVDGQFDSCITIRSLQVKNHTAFVRVGAGIVHDSIPKSEFEETEHKANSCLRAIRGE
jgi:anthranilate/para-aminobenzoate synthase component I